MGRIQGKGRYFFPYLLSSAFLICMFHFMFILNFPVCRVNDEYKQYLYQSESSKGGVATADLITSEEGDQQCLVKF